MVPVGAITEVGGVSLEVRCYWSAERVIQVVVQLADIKAESENPSCDYQNNFPLQQIKYVWESQISVSRNLDHLQSIKYTFYRI